MRCCARQTSSARAGPDIHAAWPRSSCLHGENLGDGRRHRAGIGLPRRPAVPGLWDRLKEIERRATRPRTMLAVPRQSRSSPDGRSYATRLNAVKTEQNERIFGTSRHGRWEGFFFSRQQPGAPAVRAGSNALRKRMPRSVVTLTIADRSARGLHGRAAYTRAATAGLEALHHRSTALPISTPAATQAATPVSRTRSPWPPACRSRSMAT